jgi:UDP-N-acetylglucosamine 2-epimerase (non-hydrolysing)
VVGDVNSTLACALTAAKCNIPILHVEAGLRSYDRAMPEEINRVLTDQLAELLFTSEVSGTSNLLREGVPAHHFVGNVMIDTLLAQLPFAPSPTDVLPGQSGGFIRMRVVCLADTAHHPMWTSRNACVR